MFGLIAENRGESLALQRGEDVKQVTEDPATYQRNESHSEWRTRQRLADCSMETLQARLETLTARDRTFRDRYDADAPAAVDTLDHAEYDDVETVWQDRSEWQTVRTRIERIEAVRQQRTAESSPSSSEAA